MRLAVRGMAIALALGLVAPAFAADPGSDTKDTATEKKAEAKKKVRGMKKHKSAEDRKNDVKDTAKADTAKAKKSTRHAAEDTKERVNDATK